MNATKIFGVCLARNEESFIAWALSNVADFCDEILVMDNHSDDRTPEILANLARRYPHMRTVTVDDANKTHRHVEHLAGTRTWVLGIDGDEIYDRDGLARLRPRLLAGEFDDWWRVDGHTIHARAIDFAAGTATGYVQPAARTITKLYNFAGIDSWHQPNHERLHGKDMVFRPGYHWGHSCAIWDRMAWAGSDFRCLHMCFAPRSSRDGAHVDRSNPVDVKKSRRLVKRLTTGLIRRLDPNYDVRKNYKYRYYAQGPVVTEAIAGFGRPADLADLAPNAAEIDAMFATDAWLPEAIR